MQDRLLFLSGELAHGIAIGLDERAIRGPKLFDRKVRSEQTPTGAENADGLADHMSDVPGIVAMEEGAESGELGDNIGARGEADYPRPPFRTPFAREVLEHAGVL